jgi:DNA polymerase III epsilon subunit-like protein
VTTGTEVYLSVDVEAAGPVPGEYALLSIGACDVYGKATFSRLLKPTTRRVVPEALKVTGHSLETLARDGEKPEKVMGEFRDWLRELCPRGQTPVFVGFNAPFDWAFVNYYFHRYLGENPFGFTALDIKALYMGAADVAWDETRSSKIAAALKPKLSGTHDALQDAQYQAELFRLILQARKQGLLKG